ncbi:hypothetical protein ACQKFK_17770 [Bacillus mycoides]|uniref:hypothetical protein n=1 Tax=Bacillus mycoides TaxID=1405 RepID=UPI003D088919
MALQLNVTLSSGMAVKGAYGKIVAFSGNEKSLRICFEVYYDKEAFSSGKTTIDYKEYEFQPDISDAAPNFIKQGYMYLKTIFVDAMVVE